MRKHGMPVSRQSYLDMAYGPKEPAVWGAENEAALPEELQDEDEFNQE